MMHTRENSAEPAAMNSSFLFRVHQVLMSDPPLKAISEISIVLDFLLFIRFFCRVRL